MSWYGNSGWEAGYGEGWNGHDNYGVNDNDRDRYYKKLDRNEWNNNSWGYNDYYHSGRSDSGNWYNRSQDKSKNGSSRQANEETEEDFSANATFLGSVSIANGHKKGVLRLEKQGLTVQR